MTRDDLVRLRNIDLSSRRREILALSPLRFPGERDSSKHLFNRPLPEHRSVRVVGEIVFPRGANKFALPPYFGRTSIDAVDLRTVEFD